MDAKPAAGPPVHFYDEGVWRIGRCQVSALDDMAVLDEFERLCKTALHEDPSRFVAMDFTGVNIVVTRAISILLSLLKHQRERNGTLVLCGLEPAVARVFRLTRLDRMYEMFPSIESLIAKRPLGYAEASKAPSFGP